jgi:hypothetical protein
MAKPAPSIFPYMHTVDLYVDGHRWGALSWPPPSRDPDNVAFRRLELSTNCTYKFDYMLGFLNLEKMDVPQVWHGGQYCAQLLRISAGEEALWQATGWKEVTSG